MMKNSAPNHFIWAHIFKKAPTSEGGTSPLRHPTCVTQARRLALTRHSWLPKIWPPHFENRSAAYARKRLVLHVLPSYQLGIPMLVLIYPTSNLTFKNGGYESAYLRQAGLKYAHCCPHWKTCKSAQKDMVKTRDFTKIAKKNAIWDTLPANLVLPICIAKLDTDENLYSFVFLWAQLKIRLHSILPKLWNKMLCDTNYVMPWSKHWHAHYDRKVSWRHIHSQIEIRFIHGYSM